jgi:hypothetical protein
MDRHERCAALLRAGYSPEDAMKLAGWSPASARGMAAHIAQFLAKSGHDVAPENEAPAAPAVPAGQPAPVVTVAAPEQPKMTTHTTPARRGRPPKGR